MNGIIQRQIVLISHALARCKSSLCGFVGSGLIWAFKSATRCVRHASYTGLGIGVVGADALRCRFPEEGGALHAVGVPCVSS